jgi:RimJ/RimL family protein N-acetyltransferase
MILMVIVGGLRKDRRNKGGLVESVNLVGNRIILRDWQPSDLDDYQYWQRPGHKWQELDGPYYQTPTDDSESLRKKIEQLIDSNNYPNPRSRLVISDKVTDKILGTVASYWESIETNWLCIGLTIYDPKNWGRGVGSESLSMWIQYLFDSYPQIVRLDMRTWSGNNGLIHLATKLGFQQEACFRKARIVNGEYFDGLGFGILRTEWGK